MKRAWLVTTAFAAIAIAAPFHDHAHAQKSKDTMRLAIGEPIRYIEGLFNAGVEGFLLDRVAQDNLLYWDTVEKKLKPQLATERVELDDSKREQIYNRIFGKANEERYMAPIVQAPSLIVHSKNLVFDEANILYTQGFALNRVGRAK